VKGHIPSYWLEDVALLPNVVVKKRERVLEAILQFEVITLALAESPEGCLCARSPIRLIKQYKTSTWNGIIHGSESYNPGWDIRNSFLPLLGRNIEQSIHSNNIDIGTNHRFRHKDLLPALWRTAQKQAAN
jgi:hypothetical protein